MGQGALTKTTSDLLSNGVAPTISATFWAYSTTQQTLNPNTGNKIQLNNIVNDTRNIVNTTTNRIQPKDAGYYHFDWIVSTFGNINSNGSVVSANLYKNGTTKVAAGIQIVGSSSFYWNIIGSASSIYMNGTTDYVELFHEAANTSQTGITVPNGSTGIALSGYLQNPNTQFAQALITAATDPTFADTSNKAVSADWVRGVMEISGTWTPLQDNGTAYFKTSDCGYTKRGKEVFIYWDITCNSASYGIGGLPFAAITTANFAWTMGYNSGLQVGGGHITTGNGKLVCYNAGVNYGLIVGQRIIGSCTYITNQ